MIVRLRDRGVRAIVLDIEGTTTPIAFVSDVLFPYARAHVREFLRDQKQIPNVLDAINVLRREWIVDAAASAAPAPPAATAPKARGDVAPPTDHSADALAAYVEWLMDRDRKSPGLKRLQGLVWERGYRDGELKGQVFADVPAAIKRWRERGLSVAIYSSGSVLAQRLLFSTTDAGDLTPWLSAFFDTTAGAKTSTESYARIVTALECSTEQMLFVSDVAAELDAARAAGCQVVLSMRPGNAAQRITEETVAVHTFEEIV